MASQKPFLDVQNLTKTFGAQVIFDNISFSIAEGQKVGLIAKNGTGKSTLLSILTGKEDYDAGNIVYSNGIKVGYLEQSPTFDPNESVLDACFNHDGKEEKILKAKQILTQLRIADLNQPMGQLSGGQQKRVALANILINEPDMLILDEPTNHLDIEMTEWLEGFIGMGDVLTLIEKAEQAFDEKQAEELTKKIKNDKFTLEDFLEQFQQVKKLGSMEEILGMMPGVDASKLKDAKIDQKATARVEAIIRSMTPRERRNPELLNASRKKRIAAGSGTTVQEVNRLLKQFEQSRQLMKRFAGMGRKKSGRRKGFFGF